MKALLQRQQQEEALRNILQSATVDRTVEERVSACKTLQYEQHQPLFAVYYTTIHKAAQDNSIAGLRYFLHEINNNKKDKNQKSRAVGSRTRKTAKFSISSNPEHEAAETEKKKKTVQVNDMDDFGYAAIHYAAERQSLDAIEYLLTQEVNYNLHANFSGNTAMMCAAKENKCESIRLLFGYQADLLAVNCTGMNMIHFAAQGNHVDVLLTVMDVLEFEGLDILTKRYQFKRRGNDRKPIPVEEVTESKKGSKKSKISEGVKLPPIRGATPIAEESNGGLGEGTTSTEDNKHGEEQSKLTEREGEEDGGGDNDGEDDATLPTHRSGASTNSSRLLKVQSYMQSISTFLPPLPFQPSRFSSILEEEEEDADDGQVRNPNQSYSYAQNAQQNDTMSLATSVLEVQSVGTMLSVNQQSQLEVTKKLRKLFNQQSHNLSTPLHVACQYNSSKVVQLLLDLAMMGIVKMDLQDSIGETPLHRAGRQGYRDLFQLITSYGASTTIQNAFRETPKDLLVDCINY